MDGRTGRLFNDGLQRLDLQIDAAEHARMFADLADLLGPPGTGVWGAPGDRRPPATPTWVPARWRIAETSSSGEGRLRFGTDASLAGSWATGICKLPLRLHLGGVVGGHRSLALQPGWRDPSLIRGRLASALLREAGVPAPRAATMRVYVDVGEGPAYLGLYTAFEDPGDRMPEDWFGSPGGHLYEVHGPGGTWRAWDPEAFRRRPPDDADRRDVIGAIDALHSDRRDGLAWRERLQRHLDVPGFLAWLAANTVLRNPVAYGREPGHHVLYGVPAEGGRLAWIPTSLEASFSTRGPRQTVMHDSVDASWPLIRYLLDDPHYRDMYRDAVLAFVRGPFAPVRVRERIRSLHALVAPWVVGPSGERPGFTHLVSDSAFEAAAEEMEAMVVARHAEVDRELRSAAVLA